MDSVNDWLKVANQPIIKSGLKAVLKVKLHSVKYFNYVLTFYKIKPGFKNTSQQKLQPA